MLNVSFQIFLALSCVLAHCCNMWRNGFC